MKTKQWKASAEQRTFLAALVGLASKADRWTAEASDRFRFMALRNAVSAAERTEHGLRELGTLEPVSVPLNYNLAIPAEEIACHLAVADMSSWDDYCVLISAMVDFIALCTDEFPTTRWAFALPKTHLDSGFAACKAGYLRHIERETFQWNCEEVGPVFANPEYALWEVCEKGAYRSIQDSMDDHFGNALKEMVQPSALLHYFIQHHGMGELSAKREQLGTVLLSQTMFRHWDHARGEFNKYPVRACGENPELHVDYLEALGMQIDISLKGK